VSVFAEQARELLVFSLAEASVFAAGAPQKTIQKRTALNLMRAIDRSRDRSAELI
jgi:hypothetical protein